MKKKISKKFKNILDLFGEMDKYKSCPKLNFIFDFWKKMNKKETFFLVPFFQLTLTSYDVWKVVDCFCDDYGEVFWKFSKTWAFVVTNFFVAEIFSKASKGFYYFTLLLPFSITNIFVAEKVSKDGKGFEKNEYLLWIMITNINNKKTGQ